MKERSKCKEHKYEITYYPNWSPNGGLYKKRCKICGYEED